MRKRGYILGTFIARHFKDGWSPDGSRGPYSAYVFIKRKKKWKYNE